MSTLDWVVISLYALGMLVIGWHYSRKTKSSEDYHLGGRSMASWMIGLSLFASLLSTISYLAVPGEIIKHGPMILTSIIFVFPVVAFVVGWFLIPHFMKLRITSAYEILETNLGLSIRLLGSAIFVMLRLFWMCLLVYATCEKILVPLLNLNPHVHVMGMSISTTLLLCFVLITITLIYTSMGGLQAVVLTDVIQTFILFGGAVLALVLITVKLGGVSQWFPTRWDPSWQKPVLFDFNSRMCFVGVLIADFCWYIFTCGSDQIAIQRYLATKDAKSARKAFITNLSASAIISVFLAMLGFALFAYFKKNGGTDQLADADKLFPKFISTQLPVGISGLVIAGLLAAAMSSLSSGINSSCSVIATDFVEKFRSNKLAEESRVRLDRFISVIVGITVILLTVFAQAVPGNLVGMAHRVANLLVAPLFVLFFLAMFVKWANPIGAWAATIASVTTAVLIAYWKPITGQEGISFLWIMPGSFAVGAISGSIVSLFHLRQ